MTEVDEPFEEPAVDEPTPDTVPAGPLPDPLPLNDPPLEPDTTEDEEEEE